MHICSVCHENVDNFRGKIIRGASKEWVCKECLKKANISTMRFSTEPIPAQQIATLINGETAEKETVRQNLKQDLKTITCKTCGAKLSPRAKRCPHCGEIMPGEALAKTTIGCITTLFIVIIIIVLFLYFGGFFLLFS